MIKHKQNKGESVMNKIENKQKGFTIIEVVLVLAIAGLIFLIVFLAVPALQRGRRDTQRRSDAARFSAQMESYASNRNGNYPTTQAQINSFVNNNMDEFSDPSTGARYRVSVGGATTVPGSAAGSSVFVSGGTCNADGQGVTGGTPRQIAFLMRLESRDLYCVDNQ